MKKFNIIWFVLGALTFAVGRSNAQTTPADSTEKYLEKLVASTKPEDKKILQLKLKELGAANNEEDIQLAVGYYYLIKDQKSSDSLVKVEIAKFPEGKRNRVTIVMQDIYQQKTALAKENAYNNWIKRFPPSRFHDDGMIYEYVASNIASTYAKEGNIAKTTEFADMIKENFYKGSVYGGIGGAFNTAGDLNNAAVFYKKAVDNSKPYYESKNVDAKTKFATSGYPVLTFLYAKILFELKRYDEASIYADISFKDPKTTERSCLLYAKILMALGRDNEAYAKLEQIVRSGKADEEQSQEFKKLYIKVKGSDAGFDVFAAEIRKGVLANLRQKLIREMVKTTAHDFTLTDLKGEKVSLSGLKGKVIILDFWATWCGPCKASFPAMQLASNKYKDDPNVKFLFIHTWEKSTTPAKDAEQYITAQKYDFEVLMDTTDPMTKRNKVVTDYEVKGIPAKFVIDPTGNIRFRFMGFDGNKDAAVDELSTMIELAKGTI